MANPFAAAVSVLHNGPGSQAGSHVAADGSITPVRLVRRGPDRASRFGDVQVYAGTHVVDVLLSQIEQPNLGDRFLVGDLDLTISVEPVLDVEGLTWTCGAEVTG